MKIYIIVDSRGKERRFDYNAVTLHYSQGGGPLQVRCAGSEKKIYPEKDDVLAAVSEPWSWWVEESGRPSRESS